MKLALVIGAIALAIFVVAGQAHAEDPVSLGAFQDWEAFLYHSEGAPVCYVISAPKNTTSDKKFGRRDPVWLMISNFPGRKIRGQISTVIGYPFKEQSVVTLKLDEKDFSLYPNGDTAWAADTAADAAIVKALRTAKAISVSGTSWKGTNTTDTYSPNGLAKALEGIEVACK